MQKWQETYTANTRRIALLSNFFHSDSSDYTAWRTQQLDAREEAARLRQENSAILGRYLFPALDELHSAPDAVIADLDSFADVLMDWKTNLDCGVYVAIHDALLSVWRVRNRWDQVIRELYKLGMGYYYLRRFINGIDDPQARAWAFQNELLFTEAGSYIRFYDEIDDEATRGFIIRALANTALCTGDPSRKIAASSRILAIARDSAYRDKAPGLPWDAFIRKTHQQMSANRQELSTGNLNRQELAAVLDSCYEVFRPEEENDHPSVRWLWPYYEMEYNCGYVTLETTLLRMEHLITQTPDDPYDMSGLYAAVQLPVYYGRLVRDNPRIRDNPSVIRFLDRAYRRMLQVLLSCPPDHMDDYFFYTIAAVITDYYELPGVLSYKEITGCLLKRFGGESYLRFRRTGRVIRCICEAIYAQEPDFFDDIPFLKPIPDPAQKRRELLAYAEECGLYFDFGMIKMNISRTMQTRNLFENEFRMYQLHTISGHDDLAVRPSTQRFADIALGHHRWYDGTDGYPETYSRIHSPYRMMTDIVACAAFLTSYADQEFSETLQNMQKSAGRQFSPLVMAWLGDCELQEKLRRLQAQDDEAFYKEIWDQMQEH